MPKAGRIPLCRPVGDDEAFLWELSVLRDVATRRRAQNLICDQRLLHDRECAGSSEW